MTGILVVNKPMDYTSHDVIAILKGITGEKKIGHTGTLDPNATGVLPVCFGKATRLIEYMEITPKTYVCTAKFGISSNTDDIWGEITEDENPVRTFTMDEVNSVLRSFKGEISQIPPMYSAVSVNGRRLYSYARSGEKVEVKPRTITVYDISLSGFYPCKNEIVFSVTCSRGTYIRSICKDIGTKLGCGAVMGSLVRTATSGFDISEAIDFEEIREKGMDLILSNIHSIDRAIGDMPRLMLSEREIKKFSNGLSIKNSGPDEKNIAVMNGNELAGIAKREENIIYPVKVFNQ